MEKRDWELWDRPGVASKIAEIWKSSYEVEHRIILAALAKDHLSKGDRLLEVGCGSGLMCGALTPLVPISYTGVDTSREMIRMARASFPKMSFREGDGYKLPFPDRSFDVVAAFDVLQHVPDIVGIIREMVRVSCRTVLFTLLEAPKTVEEREDILGNHFIVRRFSPKDAEARVKEAAGSIHSEKLPILDYYRSALKIEANLWALKKS